MREGLVMKRITIAIGAVLALGAIAAPVNAKPTASPPKVSIGMYVDTVS
jgi:hypothetical protein